MAEASGTPGPKAPRWAWWVATGFGSGYLKPAPGTWGSLAALAVWFGLFEVAVRWKALSSIAASWSLLGFLGPLPLLMTTLAITASGRVAADAGEKDPSWIVADEWAGQWIALSVLALGLTKHPLPLWVDASRLVAPFALFRLFDIWKPWPIFQLQSLPGGRGIVMDDVVAGLYAAIPTFFIDQAILRGHPTLNP